MDALITRGERQPSFSARPASAEHATTNDHQLVGNSASVREPAKEDAEKPLPKKKEELLLSEKTLYTFTV